MKPLQDHAGVIHFHSRHSFDGHTEIPEIVAAAAANNLNFLMLTDHNTLQARKEGQEGWHGSVLLIVGQEIAPRYNHYLAFRTHRVIDVDIHDLHIPPQTYIDQVIAQGGLGFIAHPDHEGAPLFHVKPYPWMDWGIHGHTGMGIWDFMTDWQASLNSYSKAILAFLFPGLFLKGPRRLTLTRWDWLNRTSRVAGIGESDNHATQQRFGPLSLSVFPFRKAFRYVHTHLLTEVPLRHDPLHDIPLLLQSLEHGRAYVSQEAFAPAKGFSFTFHDEQSVATMGEDFFLQRTAHFEIRLPRAAQIVLIRNGAPVQVLHGSSMQGPVTAEGVFRVEVYIKSWGKYRPWIFSNPIFVRSCPH